MRRVLRVVEPEVGLRKAERMLPNRARPRARAREEGRAFVEGNPVDRDVGVQGVEVGLDARAQERRDADERTPSPQPTVPRQVKMRNCCRHSDLFDHRREVMQHWSDYLGGQGVVSA